MYNDNYNENYSTTDYSEYNAAQSTWQPGASPKPMNYYKFLIYFALFVGAVINAFNGYQYLTGEIYDGRATLLYAFYPEMSTIDKLMGLVCIFMAIFGLYIRQQLAKYAATGPNLLCYSYYIGYSSSIIYTILSTAITGVNSENVFFTIIVSILSCAIIVAINKKYFGNRADLFVN